MDADDDFDLDLKPHLDLNQFNTTEVVHMENDGSGTFTQIDARIYQCRGQLIWNLG